MQTAAIVERGILKDQSSKVAVCSYDVVRFLFLSKLVAIVLRYFLSRLSDKTRSNQASVHSTKQAPTKYTGNAKHMERMHKNVMLSLEYEHIVEGSANTKRHSI